ncbi:MAG: peptidylprolyl isomerase [Alphaproteobacteria bacterium]
MVMQAMHSGKGSILIKGFFFGLLILAAAGLVLTDVGGFFRGGVGNNDVAKVGQDKISIVEFDRSARRTLARMGMTPQQALQMGYLNQILNGEIRRSLFQQIALDQGIKISRAEVARQIDAMIAPMVGEGDSKQEILERLLQNQGFSEGEFVRNVSAEAAAGILAQAIQNPYLTSNDNLAADLLDYQNESRSVEFITFFNNEVEGIENPSDAELQSLYEAYKSRLIIPESRTITVGTLQTDALEETIEIPEEQIRDIYNDDIEMYKVPEQRFLKQAIVDDQETAQKIFEAAQEGSDIKTAVNEATGEEQGYIDTQGYEEDGLIEDISAVVFAEESPKEGTLYGPIESPLGWHVLQLTKIQAPYTKSFESVEESLRSELLADELADQRYDMIAEVEDLLAGGASIDEINQIIPIETIVIENVTTQGAFAEKNHPLDVFGEDQQTITELAFEYFEGEASPVTELSNNNLVFVRVDSIKDQSYKPFEEVRGDLETMWMRDQKRLSNQENVSDILNTATIEETGFDTLTETLNKERKTLSNLTRSGDLQAPLTASSLETLFNADLSEMIMFEIENGYALGQITNIDFTAPENTEEELEAVQDRLMQTAPNEALGIYFEMMRQDYSIVVNDNVLQRVYGSTNTQ